MEASMKDWQVKRISTGKVFYVKAETINDAFEEARKEADKLDIPHIDLVLTEYTKPNKGKCCDKEND
jgi:hypothetical protein